MSLTNLIVVTKNAQVRELRGSVVRADKPSIIIYAEDLLNHPVKTLRTLQPEFIWISAESYALLADTRPYERLRKLTTPRKRYVFFTEEPT